MIELEPSSFVRVAPLFDVYRQLRPAIFGFLSGLQPARLYVDDARYPRTALLWSDFLYLAGFSGNHAFNDALLAHLLTEVAPRRAYTLIWSAPEAWQPVLDELLAPLAPGHYVRSSFYLDAAAFRACAGALPALPAGFRLVPLDARLAREVDGLAELWGSISQFLRRGFGYAVLQGDTLVSSSQTVFVGDNRVEVGVGTREPFRRRGFGRAAAAAVIDRCLREGRVPEWGCMYNKASGSLARSLGFVPGPDTPFHLVKGVETATPAE